jgi:hypothetical protein
MPWLCPVGFKGVGNGKNFGERKNFGEFWGVKEVWGMEEVALQAAVWEGAS